MAASTANKKVLELNISITGLDTIDKATKQLSAMHKSVTDSFKIGNNTTDFNNKLQGSTNALVTLSAAFKESTGVIKTSATTITNSVTKIANSVSKINEAFAQLGTGAGKGTKAKLSAELKEVGEFASTSLATGVESNKSKAGKAAKAVSDEVVKVTRNILDVHSESPKFVAIGQWVAYSLAHGIVLGTPKVKAAITGMFSSLAATSSHTNPILASYQVFANQMNKLIGFRDTKLKPSAPLMLEAADLKTHHEHMLADTRAFRAQYIALSTNAAQQRAAISQQSSVADRVAQRAVADSAKIAAAQQREVWVQSSHATAIALETYKTKLREVRVANTDAAKSFSNAQGAVELGAGVYRGLQGEVKLTSIAMRLFSQDAQRAKIGVGEIIGLIANKFLQASDNATQSTGRLRNSTNQLNEANGRLSQSVTQTSAVTQIFGQTINNTTNNIHHGESAVSKFARFIFSDLIPSVGQGATFTAKLGIGIVKLGGYFGSTLLSLLPFNRGVHTVNTSMQQSENFASRLIRILYTEMYPTFNKLAIGIYKFAGAFTLNLIPALVRASSVLVSFVGHVISVAANLTTIVSQLGKVTNSVHKLGSGFVTLIGHMAKVKGETHNLNVSMGTVNGNMSNIIGTSTKVGAGLAAIGVAGNLSATKVAMSFEKSMLTLQSLMDKSERTPENLKALADEAERVGRMTAFSSNEAAQGFVEMSAQGFTVKDMLENILPAAQAAQVNNMDLTSAVKNGAVALNSFGLESSKMREVMDIQTKASQLGALSMADFTQIIADGGGAADLASADFVSFATAALAVRNVGISVNSSGTTIKSAFRAMMSPTKPAIGAMNEMGMSFYNAEGKMKSYADIIGQVEVAQTKLTQQAFNDNMVTVFGTEGMNAIIAATKMKAFVLDGVTQKVLKGSAAIRYNEELLRNSSGTLEESTRIQQEGLSALMSTMGGTIETFKKIIGEFYQNDLKWFVKGITKVVDALISWEVATGTIGGSIHRILQLVPKGLRGASDAVGTFKAALKGKWFDNISIHPITAFVGRFAIAVKPLFGVFAEIKKKFAENDFIKNIVSSFAPVDTAFSKMSDYIKNNSEYLKKAHYVTDTLAQVVSSKLVPAFRIAGFWLADNAETIKNKFTKAVISVGESLSEATKKVISFAIHGLGILFPALKIIIFGTGEVKEAFANLVDSFERFVFRLQVINEQLKITETVSNILKTVIDGIKSAFENVNNPMKSTTNLFTSINEGVGESHTILSIFTGFLRGGVIGAIAALFLNISNGNLSIRNLGQEFVNLGNKLTGFVTSTLNAIGNLSFISPILKGLNINTNLGDSVGEIINFTKKLADLFIMFAQGRISGEKLFQALTQQLKDFVREALNLVGSLNPFVKLFEMLGLDSAKMGDSIFKGFENAKATIVPVITDIVNTVRKLLSKFTDGNGFINDVFPRIAEMFSKLPGLINKAMRSIEQIWPTIEDTLKNLFFVGAMLVDLAFTIADTVTAIVMDNLQSIIDIVGNFIEIFGNLLLAIDLGLKALKPFISAVAFIFITFMEGVMDSVGDIVGALALVFMAFRGVGHLLDGFVESTKRIPIVGPMIAAVGAILAGVFEILKTFLSWFVWALGWFVDNVGKFAGTFVMLGGSYLIVQRAMLVYSTVLVMVTDLWGLATFILMKKTGAMIANSAATAINAGILGAETGATTVNTAAKLGLGNAIAWLTANTAGSVAGIVILTIAISAHIIATVAATVATTAFNIVTGGMVGPLGAAITSLVAATGATGVFAGAITVVTGFIVGFLAILGTALIGVTAFLATFAIAYTFNIFGFREIFDNITKIVSLIGPMEYVGAVWTQMFGSDAEKAASLDKITESVRSQNETLINQKQILAANQESLNSYWNTWEGRISLAKTRFPELYASIEGGVKQAQEGIHKVGLAVDDVHQALRQSPVGPMLDFLTGNIKMASKEAFFIPSEARLSVGLMHDQVNALTQQYNSQIDSIRNLSQAQQEYSQQINEAAGVARDYIAGIKATDSDLGNLLETYDRLSSSHNLGTKLSDEEFKSLNKVAGALANGSEAYVSAKKTVDELNKTILDGTKLKGQAAIDEYEKTKALVKTKEELDKVIPKVKEVERNFKRFGESTSGVTQLLSTQFEDMQANVGISVDQANRYLAKFGEPAVGVSQALSLFADVAAQDLTRAGEQGSTGFKEKMGILPLFASIMMTNVRGEINNVDLSSGMEGQGRNIAVGLANGILSNIPSVRAAAAMMADAVSTRVSTHFLMASPSRLMKKQGVNVSEGLAIGITTNKAPEEAAKEKAKETAKAFIGGIDTEIIGKQTEAISKIAEAITKTTEALGKMTTYSAMLKSQFDVFMNDFSYIFNSFLNESSGLGKETIESLGAFADATGKIASTISGMVDAFDKLKLYGTLSRSIISKFLKDMEYVVNQFMSLSGGFTTDSVVSVNVFSETVGKMATSIGSMADSLLKIKNYSSLSSKTIDGFIEDIQFIMFEFAEIANDFDMTMIPAVTMFAETSSKVSDAVSKAADALQKIKETRTPNVRAITDFIYHLRMMMRLFMEASKEFDIVMLSNANIFVETVSKVSEAISKTAEAFIKIRESADTNKEHLTHFIYHIRVMMALFLEASKEFDIDAMNGATLFIETTGKVAEAIGKAADNLSKLRNWEGPATSSIEGFIYNIKILMANFYNASANFKIEFLESSDAFAKSLALAIEPLDKGFEALSKIRNYSGVGVTTIERFVKDIQIMMSNFYNASRIFPQVFLASINAFADSLLKVMGVLDGFISALTKLNEYSDVQTATIEAFIYDILIIAENFYNASVIFRSDFLTSMDNFSETLGKIVGFLVGFADALNKIRGYSTVQQLVIEAFIHDILVIAQNFYNASKYFKTEMLESANAFADTMTKVLPVISSGVEALKALRTYSTVGTVVIAKFVNDLKKIAMQFAVQGSLFNETMLADANNFADMSGKVTSTIKSGVEGFAALKEYTSPSKVSIGAFINDLEFISTLMVKAATKYQGSEDLLKTTGEFTDTAGKIVGLISGGVTNFNALADYGGLMRDKFASFVKDIVYTTQTFIIAVRPLLARLPEGLDALVESVSKIVDVLGKAFEQFSKMEEYTGISPTLLGKLVNDIVLSINIAVASLSVIDNNITTKIAEKVDSISKIIEIFGKAFDTFGKMDEYTPVSPTILLMLIENIKEAVSIAVIHLSALDKKLIAKVAEPLDNVGKIIGMFGSAYDTFSKLKEYESFDATILHRLALDITKAVNIAVTYFASINTKLVEKTAAATDAIGKIISLIGNSIKPLTDVNSYKSMNFNAVQQLISDIHAGLFIVIDTLGDVNAKTVKKIGELSESFEKIIKLIDSAFGTLSKITEYNSVPTDTLRSIANDIRVAVDMVIEALSSLDMVDVEYNSQLSTLAEAIVKSIGATFAAFQEIRNYQRIDPTVLENITRDMGAAILVFINNIPLLGQQMSMTPEYAQLLAETVNKIVEAIGKTLDAFKELNSYQSVDRAKLSAIISDMVFAFNVFRDNAVINIADSVIIKLQAFADIASKIAQTIKVIYDSFKDISSYTSVNISVIDKIITDIRLVFYKFDQAFAGFTVREGLDKIADLASKIAQTIKTVFDSFKDLDGYQSVSSSMIDNLIADMKNAVIKFMTAMDGIVISDAANELADRIGKVIQIFKTAFDSFKDLKDYTRVSYVLINSLASDIVNAVNIFKSRLSGITLTEGATQSIDGIAKIIGLIKTAFDSFKDLKDYTSVGINLLSRLFDDIKNAVYFAILKLSSFLPEQVEKVSKIAESIGKIFTALNSAFELFKGLSAYRGITTVVLDRFMNDIRLFALRAAVIASQINGPIAIQIEQFGTAIGALFTGLKDSLTFFVFLKSLTQVSSADAINFLNKVALIGQTAGGLATSNNIQLVQIGLNYFTLIGSIFTSLKDVLLTFRYLSAGANFPLDTAIALLVALTNAVNQMAAIVQPSLQFRSYAEQYRDNMLVASNAIIEAAQAQALALTTARNLSNGGNFGGRQGGPPVFIGNKYEQSSPEASILYKPTNSVNSGSMTNSHNNSSNTKPSSDTFNVTINIKESSTPEATGKAVIKELARKVNTKGKVNI